MLYYKKCITMLVSSFNLSQSLNYTPYLFHKKQFISEINSYCKWTMASSVWSALYLPFHSLQTDRIFNQQWQKLFINTVFPELNMEAIHPLLFWQIFSFSSITSQLFCFTLTSLSEKRRGTNIKFEAIITQPRQSMLIISYWLIFLTIQP